MLAHYNVKIGSAIFRSFLLLITAALSSKIGIASLFKCVLNLTLLFSLTFRPLPQFLKCSFAATHIVCACMCKMLYFFCSFFFVIAHFSCAVVAVIGVLPMCPLSVCRVGLRCAGVLCAQSPLCSGQAEVRIHCTATIWMCDIQHHQAPAE